MEGPLLKELTKCSFDLKFTVRIGRIWEHRSPDSVALYGLNFVMVDRKGGTAEGVIPKDKIQKFKNTIQEGGIYTIERFDIIKAKDTYRAADHPFRIRFIQRTIANPVVPRPQNFPMFAYTALPMSQLEKCIGTNILMSDVVGLITSMTNVIPPSGASHDPRRQIQITDGQREPTVTLCGNLAEAFDADTLHERSKNEPILVLFVGTMVGQYAGKLAFKSTSSTRWHINVDIPEMKAILDRVGKTPYEIDLQNTSTNRCQPVESTISNLASLEPTDIMNKYYKLKIKITEVASTADWWYMSCKPCWVKLKREDNIYRCDKCSDPQPFPRYKISVRAIDIDANEETNPVFAEFTFLGEQGDIITGQTADYAVAYATGRTGYIPTEILQLPGFLCFRVQTTEHVENTALLAPLPLSTAPLVKNDEQTSSSTPPPTDLLRNKSPLTSSSVSHPSHEDISTETRNNETVATIDRTKERKRPIKASSSEHASLKRSHVAKELFSAANLNENEDN